MSLLRTVPGMLGLRLFQSQSQPYQDDDLNNVWGVELLNLLRRGHDEIG